MKPDTALALITNAFSKMNSAYGEAVFDEYVLVAMTTHKAQVLHYSGPRQSNFGPEFLKDAGKLCEALEGRQLHPGDFEFVQDAEGFSFDAAVMVGINSFLLCNNTAHSMTEVRQKSLWRDAQKPFVALCEKFHSDPLEV